MKQIIILLIPALLILSRYNGSAQKTFQLWGEMEMPYYKQNSLIEYEEEAWNTRCVFNITKPTLSIYPAEGENSGIAVLIIPGGGYELVAMYHEGHDVAKILSRNGITAGVLKYRLPDSGSSNEPEKVPLSDARRALHLLDSLASEYGLSQDKIGVMGFSAGSHLATVLSLWKSTNKAENPDFSALIYGVTELNTENLKWLEESLFYRKLSPKEKENQDLLNLVNEKTPATFLVHSLDDEVCQLEETTLYAQKLRENKVPFEMHVFQKGGHGFGIGRDSDGTSQWLGIFDNWVRILYQQ